MIGPCQSSAVMAAMAASVMKVLRGSGPSKPYLSVGGSGVGDALATPFSQYRIPEKPSSRAALSAMAGATCRIISSTAGESGRITSSLAWSAARLLRRCFCIAETMPRSGMVLCLSPLILESRGDLEYLEALPGLSLSPDGRKRCGILSSWRSRNQECRNATHVLRPRQ